MIGEFLAEAIEELLAAPPPGYRILRILRPDLLAPARGAAILAALDDVTNPLWNKPARFFAERGQFLFRPEARLYLASREGGIIGFSITLDLQLGTRRVLFRWFSNFRPEHQGKGLLGRVTEDLRGVAAASDKPVFYGFRTRNPVRWRSAVRHLRRIAPDLVAGHSDPTLLALAAEVARQVYPGENFDAATMAMPLAYASGGPRCEGRSRDAAADATFLAQPVIGDPRGGILFVGEIRPPA